MLLPVAWPIFPTGARPLAGCSRRGRYFQADQIGIAFVAAAEVQAEQLPAQLGGVVADIAQAQQLRPSEMPMLVAEFFASCSRRARAGRGPFRGP